MLELLKKMELSEVESCLKAAASSGRPPRPPRAPGHSPTVATSEMIFDGQEELIDDFIEQAGERIDGRPDANTNGLITLEVDGIKIEVPVSTSTEALAEAVVSEQQWGGIIEADVVNPKEALDDEKYELRAFDASVIDRVYEYLERAASFPEAEAAGKAVLNALDSFVSAREKILPLKKRLQDIPMLQVVAKSVLFSDYIRAYERLLSEKKTISRICLN